MSDRDGWAPGVPCWLTGMQPDPRAGAAFYAAVFGWDLDDRDTHFVGRKRGRDVASITPLPYGVDPPPPPDWITNVLVASADETAARARAAGGRVIDPFDLGDLRLTIVTDPTGGLVAAVEPHGRFGAQVVNEPGAWSMSSLETPDPDAAAAFYGEVFGWTTERFAMGEMTAIMFRLPGYVGGEPEQPVSREVVATMAPAPAGTPAHWGVDFWVDDVDAAAAIAVEHGGRAVVEPFDLPIGRSAVLADPAGVAFSITKIAGT